MSKTKTKPSFSKIETYNRCPMEYRLHYIDEAQLKKETRETVKKARYGDKRATSKLLGRIFDIALSEGMDEAKKYFYLHAGKTDYNNTQLMLVEYFVNKIKNTLSDGQFGVELPKDGRVRGEIDYLSESGDVLLDIKYTSDPYQYMDPQKILQLCLYASELPKKPSTIGFLFVPHICLKREDKEDILAYRLRLLQAASEEGINIEFVEYDQDVVDKFWGDVEKIENDTDYLPTPGPHCARCMFRDMCEHSHDRPITPN